MSVVPAVGRNRVDACPGALRPHSAADGELVRLRVPGGALSPAQLLALGAAAGRLGDGRVGLTSRGNLQLRGLAQGDVAELVAAVASAGLLPDSAHERVRNVVASPLSGRSAAAVADVDALVGELDDELCARPALADLPGRFLFAVDDGSGDVAGERADVLVRAVRGGYAVRPGSGDAGVVVGRADAVRAALAVAELFLARREGAWRVRELPEGPEPLTRALEAWLDAAGVRWCPAASAWTPGRKHTPGLLEQRDGRWAVCAAVPLGLLARAQVEAVAAVGTRLRVTPWRQLVVTDLELGAALRAREALEATGLVVRPGSAWARLTACAGRPGCAKSLTDVHADVTAFAAVCDPQGPAVHWVGCERACGTPSGRVVQVVATPEGYRVQGTAALGDRDRMRVGA